MADKTRPGDDPRWTGAQELAKDMRETLRKEADRKRAEEQDKK